MIGTKRLRRKNAKDISRGDRRCLLFFVQLPDKPRCFQLLNETHIDETPWVAVPALGVREAIASIYE